MHRGPSDVERRPLIISSAQNPRFRQALRLRQRRARGRQDRILIDGQREILCAAESGAQILELFVTEQMWADPLQQPTLQTMRQAGAELLVVSPELLARLGYGGRTDQWVATAMVRERQLAEITLPANPLIAVLEGIEKPGNIGAIVRAADAAGVAAVVLVDCPTDLYNPNAIRASRGTLFTFPVCHARRDELLTWLQRLQCQILVARLDAAMDYADCDWRVPTAVVLGSEARGVTAAWYGAEHHGIRLPMRGRADSLNVATTAAVLFYEADRQRR